MSEAVSVTARNRRTLWAVFGLTCGYLVVEVAGGLLTGSLALLADAAHMLTDAGGLFAARMAARPPTPGKTYGDYRAEVLAALANAAVPLAVSVFILAEAVRRLAAPPEVAAGPMVLVAAVGLAVNAAGAWLLHRAAGESLSMRGAYLEVVGDLLSSVGVIAAAAVMWATGWYYADPVFGVVIALFILPRRWGLLRQAVDVLLKGTLARLDLAEVERVLLGVEGVASVHDLHVWTITSGFDALTAHVVLAEGVAQNVADAIPGRVADAVRERFRVGHSAVQVERSGRQADEPAV